MGRYSWQSGLFGGFRVSRVARAHRRLAVTLAARPERKPPQRRLARSQPRGSSPIACVVGAASGATILPKPRPLGPIVRSARGSATELEELALGGRRRQGGRPPIRGRRLALTAQSLKQ